MLKNFEDMQKYGKDSVDATMKVWGQVSNLDFSNLLVHRGGESEKMLCCNNFSWIQERPDADRVYAEAVCI